MKVGILSDIHGNLPALKAVLSQAVVEGIERLFVLGDIVGYYYWAAECLLLLDQWKCDFILGNHEIMLSDILEGRIAANEVSGAYGSALAATAAGMDPDVLNRLTSLPRNMNIRLDALSVFLCHGSPNNTDEYVYPDASPSEQRRMKVDHCDVIFFGHTHYPVQWRLDGVTIANPGSVGQPRNYQAGAHWMTWDTQSNEITARRESYDTASLIDECKNRDPDFPYLHQVLLRSR